MQAPTKDNFEMKGTTELLVMLSLLKGWAWQISFLLVWAGQTTAGPVWAGLVARFHLLLRLPTFWREGGDGREEPSEK